MDDYVPRDAALYRDLISNALRNDGSFNDRLDLFYNGDWQPIYVNVRDGSLSLFKQDLISNEIVYILDRDRFITLMESTSGIIYDFARFLYYDDIERILNANRDLLDGRFFLHVPRDSDRGYIPFVIYRESDNDSFHIIQPDIDGVIRLPYSLEDLVIEESGYESVSSFIYNNIGAVEFL